MSNVAASQLSNSLSPIATLTDLLSADMAAVNDCIRAKMQSKVPLIPKLADYLISSGGKRIRPLMTLACTAIYGGDMTRAHRLAAAVEFIHSATLLHDDVVDESAERRGKATANLVFGNQSSVLVGDFLFARAFELMTEDDSMRILRILSQASAIIAEGEVLQLSHMGDMSTGMDDYIKIIQAKTAALFAAACEVSPVIAGADDAAIQAMHNYGLYLGIAFQIADDALDYNADREKLGKVVGDDFREGKLTAPVLLALGDASDEEKAFWQRTLSMHEQKDGDLETAQEIINRHDALKRSLDLARTYGEKAKAAMRAAPSHAPELQQAMIDLVDYSIERDT